VAGIHDLLAVAGILQFLAIVILRSAVLDAKTVPAARTLVGESRILATANAGLHGVRIMTGSKNNSGVTIRAKQ
jgi:hypothetical protein